MLAFVALLGWFDQRPAKVLYGGSGGGSGGDYRPTTAGLEAPMVLGWSVPLHDAPAMDPLVPPQWCSDETSRRRHCTSNNSYCRDIYGGSTCYYAGGYEGNPYVAGGCQG